MEQTLFELLYSGATAGYLNIWAKKGTGKNPVKRSLWVDLASTGAAEAALTEAVRLDKDGFDVYFGVGLSNKRKDGAARISHADVRYLPAFFMDVDTHKDGSKGTKRIPADPAEALRLLNALPLPPSACVYSGHGLHAYWILREPLQVGNDLENVKRRLRSFADAVAQAIQCPGLDTHASEPARILRVPGTHNHKAVALPVELVPGSSGRRYAIEELERWALTVGTPPPSDLLAISVDALNIPSTAELDAPTGGELLRKVACAEAVPDDYAPGGRYYLADERIIDFIRRKPGGGKLLNGDTSDYEDDQSAADIALCNDLAFYTGSDRERMDALFRQTLLYRSKWDEKHAADGRTYGDMTIEKACQDTKNHYTGADYKLQTLTEERRARIEKIAKAYDRASEGNFQIRGTAIYAISLDKNGEERGEKLADFIACPVETILRDDGAEQSREYILEGFDYLGNDLPRVPVRAEQLDSFRWLMASWPGAVIEPGSTKRDKLRAAIQKVERETATRRTVYSHSGWRQINGRWAFLYNGDAVGASNVSVELPGTLARYELPKVDMSTQEAARASLGLLELAPMRVTVPLLATMYLAPLCEWFDQAGEPVNHILMIHGKTQSKKSVLSSLFLNHFGTSFTYQTMPFSFQSTVNAIREGIFLTKDLPAIVDDFHPSPTARQNNVENMTQIAQGLVRAWGDHAARQRMCSDGKTMRAAKPPRGLGIFTAEFVPDLGESGLSRCFIAPLRPGDVDLPALSSAQDAARKGVYVQAMRGYLEMIASSVNHDTPGFIKFLAEAFRRERDEINATASDYAEHGRLGTAGAYLMVGFRMMLSYFQQIGAIDDGQKADIYAKGRTAILDGLGEHARDVQDTDPVKMFARTVIELYEVGHFTPSLEIYGDDLYGHIINDTLYVYPSRLFAAVYELGRRSGVPFPIGAKELWKRLHEAGISTTDKAKTTRVPGVPNPKHVIQIDYKRLIDYAN